ncbi:MAG: bifunctional [glutamate--ammonia ligase]-adenylyl-L-tyrosine phosphorylase/[glutamate--ammonia-ligase] adenylyltransferase [Pseudomonadota bacterium]
MTKLAEQWSPWLQERLQRGVEMAPPHGVAESWLLRVQQAVAGLPLATERLLPELARGVDPSWQAALRQLRTREQMRFIARDLQRLCTLPELTRELSEFADAVLEVALAQAHADVALLHGEPMGADSGKPQQMVIIGMGKLGGHELNLSSDIDLMFTYAEDGETDGRRAISNQEFFIKVGQRIIQLLDPVTADGFVFRVDMRLRPWGDGSALAMSFDAMETYYERHGREWERYALIKARICAGDRTGGEQLMRVLRPFVFRRYIDFGVFESLREMKAMIEREVRRLDREDNIKLGRGGIREVEFIAQAFQLIRGGVDTALQERQLLKVLPMLAERGLLSASAVAGLIQAYHFLRNSEHRIQALHDQQTQMLPVDAADRQCLAEAMGFADWSAYSAALACEREVVHRHFRDVIDAREPEPEQVALPPEQWPPVIQALLDSRALAQLSVAGRERLERLLPVLVRECAAHDQGEQALTRIIPLIEATLKRSAYLVLLSENPEALKRLIDLCAASPWMAQLLARYPALLDELLNAATLFAPPTRAELAADLRAQLARVPEDDLERQMDILRLFQKGQLLRVAASDLKGTLPLMKISDSLTWIAEAVLQEVLHLSWRQLVARHGTPLDRNGKPCDPGFIIVGYGKLGGLELGYGSDLDLVFIHDADAQRDTVGGIKPLDGASFFARLGQKIIHLLTTSMGSGLLYEVDMRLRPSGASGLLVTSLDGFALYQREQAWTWEHQALVRARVVVGDPALAVRFDEVRASVLAKPRALPPLRVEVREMRQKMRDHLAPKNPAEIDLKHSPGGLVDIEFLVQYLTLAHAHAHPALTQWPDNVRLLDTLAQAGLMPTADAEALKSAYLALRRAGHARALAGADKALGTDELLAERELVQRLWTEIMEA